MWVVPAQFRWPTSIGAVPVTGEIAIVVRRCGWFRRSEGLTAQWRLDRAVRVWGAHACERGEETIWSENNDWNQFQSFLADFSVKLKTFSVWPNFTAQPNARFFENWFSKINFSQNKRSLRVNLRKLPRIWSGCRFVLEKRKVTITYNQRSWWMYPFCSCFTIYTLLLGDIRFTDSTRIYACQSHMNR